MQIPVNRHIQPMPPLGVHHLPFIFIICVFLSSCATGKLYLKPETSPISDNPGEIEFSIYAVGDAGEINDQSKAVIRHLAEVTKTSQPGLIIFLGDNIYPEGMPSEWNSEEHHHAQDILMNQILSLESFPGEIIFLPGNHDWQEGKPGGLETIKRQGQFLASLNDSRIKMLPESGCGGPVTMDLTKDIELIMFDSQWWIEDWANEPMINKGCTIDSREEFINDIEKLIDANQDKQIVFAMHHPLYSQGPHGGHYTFRDHMFPLSKVVKWLYLPLPVIGSIYPLYRTIFGHPQDVKNPRYGSLREALVENMDLPPHTIFLSGHDHSLQYMAREDIHFITSGAGAKNNAIANDPDLIYGHKAAGFTQLNFFENGQVQLMIYEIDVKTGARQAVFDRFIVNVQDN